jgi:hypothetical protein
VVEHLMSMLKENIDRKAAGEEGLSTEEYTLITSLIAARPRVMDGSQKAANAVARWNRTVLAASREATQD